MITVENLSKSFQDDSETVVALDNVSMEVPEGAVCGVVGHRGAGKSTLARCVAMLEKPDSGTIHVDGIDVAGLDGSALRAARRRIGMIPQDESLLRQRTTAGNIALPLEAAGLGTTQRRGRVAELLDLVGLTDQAASYPDRLSPAQQRRAAVARALATKPSVLLADAPTAELGPAATDSVLTVLERARSELGVTVLVVTDDLAVVRRIADDVAVLQRGGVVEQGKVLDLVADPNSHLGAALLPGAVPDQHGTTPGQHGNTPGQGERHSHDVVAEVVLVGFAAVGALLPEASSRFDVSLSILGGGLTRLGDTPVAKFRIGLSGERAELALKWMIEHDAHVRRSPVCVENAAA